MRPCGQSAVARHSPETPLLRMLASAQLAARRRRRKASFMVGLVSQWKLPRDAPGGRRREDENGYDPGEEPSHVRPPGDPAGALRDVERGDAREQLHGEPEKQVEDGRDLDDPGKDEDR